MPMGASTFHRGAQSVPAHLHGGLHEGRHQDSIDGRHVKKHFRAVGAGYKLSKTHYELFTCTAASMEEGTTTALMAASSATPTITSMTRLLALQAQQHQC